MPAGVSGFISFHIRWHTEYFTMTAGHYFTSEGYFTSHFGIADIYIAVRGGFMRLYRPVGQVELDLIASTNYKEYPPRLPEQPIFYPVLNEKYAREIAEKWNKKSADSGYAGYVTTFEIDDAYISQFDIQTPSPQERRASTQRT